MWCSRSGTRLFPAFTQWGLDRELAIIRVDADPEEPERFARPAVALIGDAKPILRRLLDELANQHRPSRRAEMEERQAAMGRRLAKLAPQAELLEAIRAELPEDGIFVDEVTQIGFAARLLLPVYKPRTFLSPGYQDNLGWGFATALGAQHARSDVPVLSISGDGGFLFTSNELATAMRHRIGAHCRRIQRWGLRECAPDSGGAVRKPADRVRSQQPGFRALCAELRRRGRARSQPARIAVSAQARFQAARRADSRSKCRSARCRLPGSSSKCRAYGVMDERSRPP